MEENALVRVESSEWITVAQLPVIEDKLAELQAQLREQLTVVSSLAPTEENYKEMKKIRSDWNKRIDALETLRKRVKAQIEAPYKQFENGKYKDLMTEIKTSVGKLDGGIKEVEGNLRDQRKEKFLAYYEEYRQSLGLDEALADPQRSGITVGLSDTMKSLKEQAKKHLDRIDGDLKMIETLDNKDEVLAEYRDNLNVTSAVRIVSDRHKRIEAERRRREAEEEDRRAREAQEASVDAAIAENAPEPQESASEVKIEANLNETAFASEQPLAAPTAAAVEEPAEDTAPQGVYSTKYLGYEIFGTIPQLKALKEYLKSELKNYLDKEGMKYGECN